MAEKAKEHPRVLLHGFLPPDLCKELEFIHRSCSAIGYRPSVFSTTLSHLIATNCAHLILPFIPIRERLLQKVEEYFGCQGELFIEFTGLISWCKGANIGWHSDDNRPYLKQRDFAAVCYLNSHEKDFKGGIFHFKDGEPASIFPVAGDVAIYTSDSRNIHSVDEITDGERLTLTLWFTRESSQDEDAKLVTLLSQRFSNHEDGRTDSYLPYPAPDNMYWFSHNQSGFDVRRARVHILGYNFCSLDDRVCNNSSSSMPVDPLEQLSMPLRLGRGGTIFDKEFANSLHALQVVQFYCWKASELKAARRESPVGDGAVEPSLVQMKSGQELVFPCDVQLAETVLSWRLSGGDEGQSFDWNEFSAAALKWEDHAREMHQVLLGNFPIWRNYQTIFSVAPAEIDVCFKLE